jgi:hypothetical protein
LPPGTLDSLSDRFSAGAIDKARIQATRLLADVAANYETHPKGVKKT